MSSTDIDTEACCQEQEETVVAATETEEEFYLNKQTRSEERLSVCKECPELIGPLNNCRQCGCFMNIKVRIYSAACPLGKW